MDLRYRVTLLMDLNFGPHPPPPRGGSVRDWLVTGFCLSLTAKIHILDPKTRFFAAPAGAFAPRKVQMDKMHLRSPVVSQ